MTSDKKGKRKLQNHSCPRNSGSVNCSIQKPSSEVDTISAAEQSVDTTSPEMTASTQPATNISEPSFSGVVLFNTISKQVKGIFDFLPEVALREDLQQLIDATSGQGKIISQRLEDKLDSRARDVNFRLTSIDTLTKNVDRKIDGVLKKKDLDFVETRLSSKIQQAETSVAQIARSEVQRGLQSIQRGFGGLEQIIADKAGNVANEVKNFSKTQRNANEALTTQLSDVEGRLKKIGESTEMIQSLPSKIDNITEILSAKGLQIKQEFPAINHDEETLAQLAQYGEKILQQLAIAARWYARKMPEISKHETEIKNLTETHTEDLTRAAKDGEARGRKAVVRDLLARYGENIHDLMESAENEGGRLKVLADFLKNEGVEPIYQLHEEREITDDNLMNYEHNIANLRAGKIVITSPGYSFDNEVISKATYMPAEEFYAAQVAEQQVEENSAVDTETENTAPDSQAEENFAPQADDTPHESENVVQGDENSAVTNEVASNEKVSAEG